ncbi:folate-binding protein [Sphingomonas sp. RRHST34]|uniref:Folate-binding protein n=1 Tax=Sphingomonas citri TaxID=2862499 RepID=A0ABS7BQA2_9SPHN|nr:folate-binding protein [Sphingomonas citri]MBW6531790.1 folate-binding protein [Sphingomonas citri]
MTDTRPATTLADRALLRLAGDDPRGFLQGLVTNDMAGPLPCWAGLLSPQGKALFDFLVWADGADLLLDVERDARDALARRLTMYRLRRAITIASEDSLAVHWSPERPADDAVPDPRLAALGWRWLAPADAGDASASWRTHRLAQGVAEGRAELGDGETLWLEANARELGGVSFAKGCYVGQENTARMHHRSKVNRRLVVAPLAPDEAKVRALYPELGLMVALRRVEALGDALRPTWLAEALDAEA